MLDTLLSILYTQTHSIIVALCEAVTIIISILQMISESQKQFNICSSSHLSVVFTNCQVFSYTGVFG